MSSASPGRLEQRSQQHTAVSESSPQPCGRSALQFGNFRAVGVDFTAYNLALTVKPQHVEER
jgi:hypothetical protein